MKDSKTYHYPSGKVRVEEYAPSGNGGILAIAFVSVGDLELGNTGDILMDLPYLEELHKRLGIAEMVLLTQHGFAGRAVTFTYRKAKGEMEIGVHLI